MYDEFGVQEIFPVQPTQTQQQNQGHQPPQAQTGISTAFDNPFGFTGYQLDDITDMHYAQARYYAPKQAALWQMTLYATSLTGMDTVIAIRLHSLTQQGYL